MRGFGGGVATLWGTAMWVWIFRPVRVGNLDNEKGELLPARDAIVDDRSAIVPGDDRKAIVHTRPPPRSCSHTNSRLAGQVSAADPKKRPR